MASCLITGCSRGLGLELTKQLSSQPAVDSSNGRINFVLLDVAKEDSIAAAVLEVTQILGAGNGLDLLINNAGIQILEQNGVTGLHALTESFDVNVIAVHNVSVGFLPLLSSSRQKKLVIITSELGSITNTAIFSTAPFPSYKVSKAAVNMLMAQYAMELGPKGFTVFAINPGWLSTDMGGSQANLEPVVGACQVVEIIQKATPADNGSFRQIYVEGWDVYDGKNIPW
ncbi:hypothetical protein BP5796_12200 [Coleophoma crateriformis]|uniref:Uncharacterized protein n=1 Tax=Coleophoma crateriformis TaxID=565419 RepID=A0A3D8Q9D0_9HELO|nr:hypothetical protein BP5796_12200 [Coleophoma crateriformis]